ncbi:hypothetical protein GCM10023107_75670 [Actinoplanes octamycinicus]|nr:hypothetical protein Aoc01nite_52640 [Actinoplanes octamycinicus]
MNGFGLTLMPNWPYSFERDHVGSHCVRVTRWTSSGPVQVVIDPSHRLVDASDVVDAADGLDVPYWLIETSLFRVRWPAGFTVDSPRDAGDGTPFYLQGPGRAAIFPQGPVANARLADSDALVAPDQTVLAQRVSDGGIASIELSYSHDGESWWQAHWKVPFGADNLVVITAQSLLIASEQTREAAEAVVAGFERTT